MNTPKRNIIIGGVIAALGLVLSGCGAVSRENSRLIINDPNRIKLLSSNKNVTIPEYGGEVELSANTDYFTIDIG